jgi:hypothetical protein
MATAAEGRGVLTLGPPGRSVDFEIVESVLVVGRGEGVAQLDFEVRATRAPGGGAGPELDLCIMLAEFSPEALVGQSWAIPFGYDAELEDWFACALVDDEPQDLNDVTVEVLAATDDVVHARVVGCTPAPPAQGEGPDWELSADVWFSVRPREEEE